MKKLRFLCVLLLIAAMFVISLCTKAYASPYTSVSDDRLTKYIFNSESDFDDFSAKIRPSTEEGHPYSIAFMMTNKPESHDELDEYSIADPERVDCTDENLPHTFVKDKVLKLQSCTDEGEVLNICKVCGKEEIIPIPADGHSFVFWMNRLEPTCTSTGIGINVCEICELEEEFEIPTVAHSYGEPVISSSCTEPTTETYTCTVCGDIKVVEISGAPGHLWGKWKEDQPVCDKEGERIRYCSVCNESEKEIIPAGEHDWADWFEMIAPGCLTNGKEKRICMNCLSTETRSTAPIGHKWGDWETLIAAGCTTEGERSHTCKVCSVVENEVVAAAGHAWNDWQTITAPTFLEEGIKIRYCAVCMESETATVPQKKNPFNDVKPEKWYTTPILYCLQYEYMVGISDDSFSLSQPVTRAMIVQIMAKIAGADLTASEYQKSTFVDVANGKWYTSAVTWANKNALASGIGEGHFGYKNSITREELAVFLMKLTEYSGYSTTVRGALANGYKDTARIHAWAVDAMDWALTCGVMHGSTPQHVSPRIPLTRAQVAEIVYDYCNKILDK